MESILNEEEVNVNVKEYNSSAFTALHHAASKNYEKVLKLLLCCPKVDVDARDGYNRTPLMLASELGPCTICGTFPAMSGGSAHLHLAARKGHSDVASVLVEEDDFDQFWKEPEDDDGVQSSPLIPLAVHRAHSWKIYYSPNIRLQLMEQKTSDANFTALHMAAKGFWTS